MVDQLLDVKTIPVGADHVLAQRHLRRRRWVPCGRGDWAVALKSPSGRLAARISPFDPTAPFTAELYRSGQATGWFPQLFLERALEGGGSLLVMEFLRPVDDSIGVAVHRRLRDRDPGIAEAAGLIEKIHRRAMEASPWCGPVDDNPANIMAAADGSIRITDPYYAAGPALYGAVQTSPLTVARAIPNEQRRHIFEIPLASSGGWDPAERLEMRQGLERADEILRADGTRP
ncbi:hypothetical protein ACFFGH_28995 [Lysobacter korlensis]|uniref:Protein kinase domain-containing protein n=1 Tax=Lysobacter korlensis TaxID=553636 RepID=A0ABV6RY33_9GAMM